MWNPLISKMHKQWSEKEMEADIINNGKMKGTRFYRMEQYSKWGKEVCRLWGIVISSFSKESKEFSRNVHKILTSENANHNLLDRNKFRQKSSSFRILPF